jgi:hypothetical protein
MITPLQVVTMEDCNEVEFDTPLHTPIGNGSSTSHTFQTPSNLIEAACRNSSGVTPVMQAALDPLMHKSLQTPPPPVDSNAYGNCDSSW